MKKFVKLVPIVFINEARDTREVKCVYEIGNIDVNIVAKGDNRNEILKQDFYILHRLTTRPIKFFSANINRFVSFFLWARYVRLLKADIISCHDIICLAIGYISTLLSTHKPKLIYDSHEFELGRNAKRNTVVLFFLKYIERFLIKRCAFAMMVNDSIADMVQGIHSLKERPIVVRNVQDYVEVDVNITKKYREMFYRKYDIKSSDFIIMYHGGITTGRGVEAIIEAVKDLDGVKFIILGFGQQDYINTLTEIIENNQLSKKVFFHSAVHQDELWKYIGAVDAGVVMIDNICLSYYYSLPNKFFQNVQAHTPIIGSNFPEIRKMIEKYNIGLVCNSDSPDDLRYSILKLKNDKKLYNTFKLNLGAVSRELCWEKEKEVLMEAYKRALDTL